MDGFDSFASVVALQAHQLQQADLGNGVTLTGARHNQGRDNGQRERNLDLQRCAFTNLALDVNGAADLLQMTRSTAMPAPSSEISMLTWPPSW